MSKFDEADPNWFWNWDSQLAAKSKAHADFQTMMRDFMDTEILPHIADWEEAGGFPEDLTAKAYAAGVYAAGLPKEYGGTGEEMDPWRRFIYNDELGRSCAGGLWASLLTHGISLPPILALGSEQQKQKYAKDIITGVKRCSLAITEPNGGSDVANIQTTAVREKDVYVVTGQKTYISGGMNADYFTTGVRTGSSGIGGISLLMIHRDYPGVQTTRLKTQGWGVSTTTSVAFNDVRVPVENRLGVENQGFLPIMLNFNNERMSMAYAACRMSRCCLEDAIRFARVRKTFGKPLVQQQVIRHKMAEMARLILSTHGFLASVTETMAGDDYGQLAGKVALAKVQATKTLEFCAREASQILGGRSYLRGNHIGGRIERSYREVRVYAIGGGSEEIMLDLAARAAKL
ncbi:Acyl-CoA dehydrogenase AFT10-1 (AF-toxin biosynthesis protein 10-1) [Durusdinium trenchii]|uniref:Acyl-CoA dehydrogenase AFT10-1 (AF-toxin biosynthesis protein 10-1) n=1 Tax=Durusdinium trenchii TaxID=1381693 RepID=A0ABP0J2M2_9DINO